MPKSASTEGSSKAVQLRDTGATLWFDVCPHMMGWFRRRTGWAQSLQMYDRHSAKYDCGEVSVESLAKGAVMMSHEDAQIKQMTEDERSRCRLKASWATVFQSLGSE